MTEIENNPHQALIEEKVAEFKETSQTYIKCGWDETNNLAFKQFEVNWTEQQVDWLTQTLQAYAKTVAEEAVRECQNCKNVQHNLNEFKEALGEQVDRFLTPLPNKD